MLPAMKNFLALLSLSVALASCSAQTGRSGNPSLLTDVPAAGFDELFDAYEGSRVVGDDEGGGINIEVLPGLTPDETRVKATGSDSAGATPTLRDAFGLNDQGAVTRAMKNLDPAHHNYTYVWCPGPNEPLPGYWHSVAFPDGSHLTDADLVRLSTNPGTPGKPTVNTIPVIVDKTIFDNAEQDHQIQYVSTINDTVTDSSTSSWNKSQTAGVSIGTTVKVGLEGSEASGTTTMSYSDTWGKGGSSSTTTSIADGAQIWDNVPAHQCAVAALTAERGRLSVDVPYTATITGWCVGHSTGHHSGTTEHFYNYGVRVGDLLREMGRTTTASATQTVSVDFYAQDKLAVYPLPQCDTDPDHVEEVILGRPQ